MSKLKTNLQKLSQKTTQKSHEIQELSSFLGQTVRENKKQAALVIASLAGFATLFSAQPIAVQFLTNATGHAIATGSVANITIGIAVGYGLLEVGNSAVRGVSMQVQDWFLTRFGNTLIEKNIKTVMDMPHLAQKEKTSSYLSEVVGRASSRGKHILRATSWGLFNGGAFVLSSAILLGTAPLAALGLVGVTTIKAYASHRLNKKFKDDLQAIAKQQSLNASRSRDVLKNAHVVRANNKEAEELKELNILNQDNAKAFEKLQSRRMKFETLLKGVDFLGSLAIILPAIYTAMKTGDLGTYFLITGSAYRVLYGGSSAVSEYSAAQESFLAYQESMKELAYDLSLQPKTGEKAIDNCQGNIAFKDVQFAYPEQDNLFDHLNLTISKGERVVIVGKTGGGKTSLVSLLKHDMEIQGGSIQIDGIDIRDVSQKNLNEQISYVTQSPQFLDRSIMENLMCVNPAASMDEITQCLKKAGVHDELMARPDKLEANPSSLSGGQQQRLAIAQAFLRKSPIVIMDEPTGALDRYTAKDVLNSILAFGKDRTLILISHNPAEIAKADRALLLEKGKIVEQGPPKDLIAKRGYFYGLYKEELELFRAAVEAPPVQKPALAAPHLHALSKSYHRGP